MLIAFVISAPEEEVVNAIAGDGDAYPRMDGSLFKFTDESLNDFMERVGEWMADFAATSDEFQAALRLIERLGTWRGQQIAEVRQADAKAEVVKAEYKGKPGKAPAPEITSPVEVQPETE